jgi:serine/threonine protein kinase
MQGQSHLLQEGVYGCIFTSKLHCKKNSVVVVDPSKDIRKGIKVNKLLLIGEADTEISISKRINKIPYANHYFIVSESICEPAAKQTEAGLNKCTIVEGHSLTDFRILSIPYGGVDMKQYKPDVSRFSLTYFFSHLVEAGALMNLFGIVHSDLHEGNVVMDSHGVPRIIDFNISLYILHREDIMRKLSHLHNLDIVQESPDCVLINAIQSGMEAYSVMESISAKKKGLSDITSILAYSQSEMKKDLYEFYRQSESAQSGKLMEWFDSHWHTIDSWSIAYMIIQRWKTMLVFPSFMKKLEDDSKKDRMVGVLRKMLHVNPFKRIDCVQALAEWNPSHHILTLPVAKKWLKSPNTE